MVLQNQKYDMPIKSLTTRIPIDVYEVLENFAYINRLSLAAAATRLLRAGIIAESGADYQPFNQENWDRDEQTAAKPSKERGGEINAEINRARRGKTQNHD